MMVCVHAAVGAALGAFSRRPAPAFSVGVASHLACDLLPHKDYSLPVEAPLAFLMFIYLGRRFGVNSPQFFGAMGAVFPDGENALHLLGFWPEGKTFFPSHNPKMPWFLGHGRRLETPISQVFLAAFALWLAGRAAR